MKKEKRLVLIGKRNWGRMGCLVIFIIFWQSIIMTGNFNADKTLNIERTKLK
jgi:hypothetical protein